MGLQSTTWIVSEKAFDWHTVQQSVLPINWCLAHLQHIIWHRCQSRPKSSRIQELRTQPLCSRQSQVTHNKDLLDIILYDSDIHRTLYSKSTEKCAHVKHSVKGFLFSSRSRPCGKDKNVCPVCTRTYKPPLASAFYVTISRHSTVTKQTGLASQPRHIKEATTKMLSME